MGLIKIVSVFPFVSFSLHSLIFSTFRSYSLTKMLTIKIDVDDNYTFIITKELITVDDGKEKTYFVPSGNQVFLKTARKKAQTLTIYNVDQQVSLFCIFHSQFYFFSIISSMVPMPLSSAVISFSSSRARISLGIFASSSKRLILWSLIIG